MSDEHPTSWPEAEIVTELANRVQAELPLLADHLRAWLEAHLAVPREISVSLDPDGTRMARVWLVTHDTGERDASYNVVYDATRNTFGLVTELQNGVLWYMGPYGSLVDTVQSI